MIMVFHRIFSVWHPNCCNTFVFVCVLVSGFNHQRNNKYL